MREGGKEGTVGSTSITSEKSIADKYALVAARWLDSLYLQPRSRCILSRCDAQREKPNPRSVNLEEQE